MKELLSEVLRGYLDQTHTGVGWLAKLSDVPKKTLDNWLGGHSVRPRRWQDIVKVAWALHLSEVQADRLLLAASHDPVRKLLAQAQGEDRLLLAALDGHAGVVDAAVTPARSAPRPICRRSSAAKSS